MKNELTQGETLVKELQSELEIAAWQPDLTTKSMQTSPLFSPKKSPKSSQTSPLISPKDSPKSVTGKTSSENENRKSGAGFRARSSVISSGSGLFNKSEHVPPSSLHSEMEAAGVTVPDPYDSEGALPSDENISEPTISVESLDTATHQSVDKSLSQLNLSAEGESVSLFIACDDYVPSIMSPNPDSDIELQLKKGDYVYILGDIDDDGFYAAQLADGKKGLVPSNYVKKLTDNISKFSIHVMFLLNIQL